MLTQQQADDYNIWQHELEAIEIWQNTAQKQINSYVDALSKVSDMMATATPEMMDRIRKIVPRLVEGYNNAKLKLSSYEDRHQQALSKVNEYKALETQPTSTPVTKRRPITPDNFDWNAWWNNEYNNADTSNSTNTLDTYKDDPLYPEFQDFLKWRDRKNTFINNFVSKGEENKSPTINLSTNNISKPTTQFTYRPNTRKFSLYS